MKNFKIISHNENETKNFAKNLASKLSKGDIIVLTRRIRFWKNKIHRRFFVVFWLRKWDI